MPKYSKKSSQELSTCNSDLQKVFNIVIKFFDCTILYGNRSRELQFELFKQGRSKVDGKWVVVDKKLVVTDKDGYTNLSKHNYIPSEAVDAIPYPLNWGDTNRMRYFAGFVVGIAQYLYSIGEISHRIKWGGDWDSDTDLSDQNFNDLVHFEIY